ncbi:Unspecific monooxygenase [Trichostrongylus colubriformis]|uniref:Unspecific monooxygenase n=1 Tax=Trichostrongylus colubriformis TaxID=6319 RepID=A0AAN8FYS4_TRICO
MTESIKSKNNEKIDMQDIIDVAVGSVINQLLFGYRFDEDHVGEFRELKTMLSRQMKETAHPSAVILFMFPGSKYLPYFNGMWKKILSYRDAFYAFFDRQIEAHRKEIDYECEHSNDYVEAFLKEQKRREADGDLESFKHIQLQNMCLDLWFAGMETTSNTLSWAVVFILNHMDVQAKMHEEMDREIGSSRAITMADRNRLPYTNAVVNVSLRVLSLLRDPETAEGVSGVTAQRSQRW